MKYAPNIIIAGQVKYTLKNPLECLAEKEENYYVIQSKKLGIIGTGLTESEAETAFAQEFDYVYQRFNSLDNKSLTNHNLIIKNLLNELVEKVEQ